MKAKRINLTIKQKMLITVAVAFAGMLTVGVLVQVGFAKIQHEKQMMEKYSAIDELAARGSNTMLKAREYESEFFTRKHEKWIGRVKQSVEDVNKRLDELAAINSDAKIKGWCDRAKELSKNYVAAFTDLAAKAQAANFDPEAIADGREELRDSLNEFEPLLDSYIPKQAGASYLEAKKKFDLVMKRTKLQILGGVSIVALFIIILLSAVSVQISRSLRKVIDRLRDIADGDGDLTRRIDIDSKDELGMLAGCFNSFVDKLHGVIRQVASSAEQVASAASQLNWTAEQMATGVDKVALQAGTVATASEEMAATSNDIARNCSIVAQGAEAANNTALDGAYVVQNTVHGMSAIAERVMETAKTVESLGGRSNQIGEIISTIEDIADQTNLLALNAAIEAARAGEQGRGFAVVADEVRALAERTSKATKEISQMINGIQSDTKAAVISMGEGVREVEKGTEEAAKSGTALSEIIDQITSVTMQVGQIAVAAEEQTATIGEINCNISQISDVVQETAKGAQDSAAASRQLADLAEQLHRLVGQFKLAA